MPNQSVSPASPVSPVSPEPPPAPRPWEGQVTLTYQAQAGNTQVQEVATRSPLRLQRPFYPEGAAVCHSVIVHTAGGMVGGDRLNYHIHLRPQTTALITTAAAHKVYRSAAAFAQQNTHIRVDAGAWLEWFPQETILFRGAHYQQQIRIELEPEATWVGWDLTRFGRSARGEQFDAGHWRSQVEVWRGDRPLWIDRQSFAGSPQRCQSPQGLGGQPVVGVLAYVGQPVTPELVQKARHLAAAIAPTQTGVSRLEAGLLCRYRGDSTQAARQWFQAVWQELRLTYRGRAACPPRVW